MTTEDVREQAEGLAASEEELVLIAMFGTDAEELLRMIRARHSSGTVLIAEGRRRARRAHPRARQDRAGERRRRDRDRRRGDARLRATRRRARPAHGRFGRAGWRLATSTARSRLHRRSFASSRRWSASSIAPNPGAPAFVDIGDTVVPGQTLCVLEAMKLFNELKAETTGTVRAIHVENAQPVEFGQLFEVEPILAPPAV